MGSRGFVATRRESSRRLGCISDYCVRHCVCLVVVVCYTEEKDVNANGDAIVTVPQAEGKDADKESHDASDVRKVKLIDTGCSEAIDEYAFANVIM